MITSDKLMPVDGTFVDVYLSLSLFPWDSLSPVLCPMEVGVDTYTGAVLTPSKTGAIFCIEMLVLL